MKQQEVGSGVGPASEHPIPLAPVRVGMPKRTPAAQARRNKQRGAEGELEVCRLLSDELGFVVQRRLGQARDGGGDIQIGPFTIEVKRRRRIAGAHEWMEQAARAVQDEPNRIPVIAFRADGRSWLVAFLLSDAIRLMREQL